MIPLHIPRWFALATSLLLLAGCASQSPLPSIDNWDHYQQRLAAIDEWQLQGKIGFRLTGPEGRHSGSANFNWQQQPRDYAIRLYGPLGQGSTWIKSDGKEVKLEQAGKQPLTATSPEELMYQSLGWWLPINDLTYWIRGIPAPYSPIIEQQQSPQGPLNSLHQAGWQLTYSRYNQVEDWQLPGKIVAQRGDIKLTLILKEWQLN